MQSLNADASGIALALRILGEDGVLAHATETCYGLTCDLSNPDAVLKLFDIKQRPYEQPVSALFSSIEEAKRYVVFSPRALELAEKYLPGPLTLVLPMRVDMPTPLTPIPSPDGRGVKGTLGIRISSYPLAAELVRQFGKPIVTTSANLHGQPNPYSVADIQHQFEDSVLLPDLILDSGSLVLKPASTVVEVVDDVLHILRQGDLRID